MNHLTILWIDSFLAIHHHVFDHIERLTGTKKNSIGDSDSDDDTNENPKKIVKKEGEYRY